MTDNVLGGMLNLIPIYLCICVYMFFYCNCKGWCACFTCLVRLEL